MERIVYLQIQAVISLCDSILIYLIYWPTYAHLETVSFTKPKQV